jgi:general secretion pathway protein A
MYQNHYNLRIKPFEPNPDPRFIWLSEKHKEALASLKYGLQENKGFLLLTGDIGTGKTTLLNYFLNEINTDAVIASIYDPDLSIFDFFELLSREFNINLDFDTKGEFLNQFEDFLHNTYSEERKALLIIDEAQRLNQQLLEQIRLLSNIEKTYAKLINIFLVGQKELHKLIMDEQNRALRQRLAIHYNIEPLTELETRDYIKHRLRIAGPEKDIFTPQAVHEIYSFSKGYPRLINTICDRALLSGYVSDLNNIDAKIIQKCADELMLPSEREDARNAASRVELEIHTNEKTLFTWNPNSGEDQHEVKVDENIQLNIVDKPPKSVLLLVIFVLFIWIAAVLSLYNWFGP